MPERTCSAVMEKCVRFCVFSVAFWFYAIYPGPSNCLPQVLLLFCRNLIYVWNWYAVDDGHALLAPERFHGFHGLVVAQLLRFFVCDEYEVISEQLRALFHIVLLCLLWRHSVKAYDERFFDTEHGVRGLVLGATDIKCTSNSISH